MKSKKTVASMIERKGDNKENNKKTVKIIEHKKEEPLIEINEPNQVDLIMANRKKLSDKLIKKPKIEMK